MFNIYAYENISSLNFLIIYIKFQNSFFHLSMYMARFLEN